MSGSPPVLVRVRTTGALVAERVFGEDSLRLLYGPPAGRLLERLLVSRPLFSRLYGLPKRLARSRRDIPRFVASLGIDPAEAELPLDAYHSLDDFFTRRLAPGVRPIDRDPASLVSPGDGRLLVLRLESDGALTIKGCRLSLPELLGDPVAARRYQGGTAFLLRLAPADYHRFHFPDDGVAGPPLALPGPLHSVHPIARAAGAPSLRNQRHVTSLASAAFGRVALVEVGALAVGTIIQTFVPGPIKRGQEKGYFRFGGSTIVVLGEPGRIVPDPDLVAASAAGLETLVAVGTRIGRSGPG